MSAEVLRRAASLMRERAEKASQGGYGFESKWTTPTTMLTRIKRKGRVIAEARDRDALWDLNHLSYWHPAVALAVADWLDEAVGFADEGLGLPISALAVARAYVGEPV